MKKSYVTFTRTWWIENPDWPDGLEPYAGQKQSFIFHETEEEAMAYAKKYNAAHDPGRLSKKMEYEEV